MGELKIQSVQDNISWLNANPVALNDFVHNAISHQYEDIKNLDLDSSLYSDGIFKDSELSDINTFHNFSVDEKINLIKSGTNNRILKIGSRIIFRNFSNYIDTNLKEKIKNNIVALDSISLKGQKRRTPKEAIEESKLILKKDDIDNEQIKILNDYIDYLN